ncbi:hypothetical protein F4778DRAFT_424623 [Xylariomycetidae sp. FL2044]|nr:hypothetical protein F4778DRAFT_424623 [Xylariomycetidae sp. FL2044]
MAPKSYWHKYIACGRSRLRAFHRQYPAGPGYPVVKSVCGTCRPLSPPSSPPSSRNDKNMHVHYYHWLHLPDEPESVSSEHMRKKASASAVPRPKRANIDPPPGYPELPADQNHVLETRLAELADTAKVPPASFRGARG